MIDGLTIRPATDTDLALIYSSWLKSYWFAVMRDSGVTFNAYQDGQRARVARLMGHVEIACSPEAPDSIMGWRCADYSGDKSSLHYVYVRQLYRRQGIAKWLLGTWEWRASHMTPVFARAFPNVPYNPYLLEAP